MSQDIICIVGPTAVGKTRLSVQLAKELDGEIISGDSMQIYRGLDIGTAKASFEERQGIPHHLLDEKDPAESYSVAEFQKTVRLKIQEIQSRGKIPILVGGTGLYIKSVLYDYEFSEEVRDALQLRDPYPQLDNDALHQLLAGLDPVSAEQIHPNNRQRTLRAIQAFEQSGIRKSDREKTQEHKLIYPVKLIGLTDERQRLYQRIDARVDQMAREGLVDEVRRLYDAGIPKEAQSVRAIGYKELYDHFDGLMDLDRALELIKRNSRRYAKRQYTWFKNQMTAQWFEVEVSDFEKTIAAVISWLKVK